MKKLIALLMIALLAFSACGEAAEPKEPAVGDNVLDVPQEDEPKIVDELAPEFNITPIPTSRDNIPPFIIECAFKFSEEDLQGRTPIYFDGGDERMRRKIFYSDEELHDLRFYRWSGWGSIGDELALYRGNLLFDVDHVFTKDYYIDFLPPFPAGNDYAVVSFKDSEGREHSYSFGYDVRGGDDSRCIFILEARLVDRIIEPEILPTFRTDFARNFTEEDLQGRTQIFYDSGCDRMESVIFYSDSDLHDLRFYNYRGMIWDEKNFEFIFVIGDFFFEVNHLFTSEYYIEFIPRIPAKNDFAVFSFKDSNGEIRYYVLAHNLNPDIDSDVNYRQEKRVQYGYN